jgi:NAD(P)-dependent dehydrogenase (short-subunit alcohol dehydrogenase family)
MSQKTNRIAIVTGANTGLGYETSRALAKEGLTVILACRNSEKAKRKILDENPKANLEYLHLDLADFASVRAFAENFQSKYDRLDLLINNAGVMMPPFKETEQGYELQWGVNYLGHFLLTKLLFELLKGRQDSRIIQLSSLAHKWGNPSAFESPLTESNYDKQKAYGNSKLACLVFAMELDRRLRERGLKTKSLAAHPGVADTELSRYLPKWMRFLSPLFMLFVAQSAEAGAQPTLKAATDGRLAGGAYLGPGGFKEYKGKAKVVEPHPKAIDPEVGKKLWKASEKQVGTSFAV